MSASKRTAFILGGGASRGAYQVGCIKRLEEEGISPDIIIGSSIGAVNSLLWLTGGADHAWGFWSRAVSLPRIIDISLRHNPITSNALFSMDRFVRYVEKEIDFKKCFHSEVDLSYVVANLTEGHEELRGNRTERSLERFRKVTRIAYAIPVLHPLIELDGNLYSDGGLLWNIPFEHAEELGATDIYILSVVPSRLPKAKNLRFIPQVSLRFYEMFWRTFGNSSHIEKHINNGDYHGITVSVIEPSTETGMFDPIKMLHAHPGKSKKLLWAGYNDTDAVLKGKRKPRSGRIKGYVPDGVIPKKSGGRAAKPRTKRAGGQVRKPRAKAAAKKTAARKTATQKAARP